MRCVAPLQCNDGGNKLVVAPPEVGSVYSGRMLTFQFDNSALVPVLGLAVKTFPIS